jgi:hypothetical protein
LYRYVTGLNPGVEHTAVVVAHDTPGGPFGPNLQPAVSVRYAETVGLTLSEPKINVVEGGEAVNYAILLSGTGDGELAGTFFPRLFQTSNLADECIGGPRSYWLICLSLPTSPLVCDQRISHISANMN